MTGEPNTRGVLIGLAIFTIFVTDSLTPLSYAVWLLYVIPLLLAGLSQRGPNALVLVGVCSLLTVLGFAVAPPGTDQTISIVNRLGGILVLWLTTVLLAKRHRAESALQKRSEELEEVKQHLEQAQAIARLGSWELDPETGHGRWSAENYRVFGRDPSQGPPTMSEFMGLIHPDDRPAVLDFQARADAEGSARVEIRTNPALGPPRWIQGTATASSRRGHNILEGTAQDITERRHAEDEVRELSGRILQVQDEERRRLARELHDQTAQELAAVAMNLSTLRRLAPDLSHKALALLDETAGLTERAAQEIRTLAYLLHSPLLEYIGLVAAVRDYVSGFASRSNIVVVVEADATFVRLPGETELALFRIVQEALGNVHRHSGSPTAAVCLTQDAEEVCLEVRDSGRGFGTGGLSRLGMLAGEIGIGIAGMRERMRQLGGQLKIESSPRGTTVRAILPVAKER